MFTCMLITNHGQTSLNMKTWYMASKFQFAHFWLLKKIALHHFDTFCFAQSNLKKKTEMVIYGNSKAFVNLLFIIMINKLLQNHKLAWSYFSIFTNIIFILTPHYFETLGHFDSWFSKPTEISACILVFYNNLNVFTTSNTFFRAL